MSKNSEKKRAIVKDFERILHDIEVKTAQLLLLQNQLEVFIMSNTQVRCSCQVMRDGSVKFVLSQGFGDYAKYDRFPLKDMVKAIEDFQKLSLLAQEGVEDE